MANKIRKRFYIQQSLMIIFSTSIIQHAAALDTEWWHYFLSDGSRFEILDIDFKKLKKAL